MTRMVIIKNTTEEVETMDQEAVMKVRSLDLDRTASEVNGVKTLVVYDLVRETGWDTTGGRTSGSKVCSRTTTTGWLRQCP